ncbi:MAG TPA: hypothetical protein VKV26_01675 [Dehalococcoidia bacterium]|nr:hypothetical protein [Dehalococcoidia bacterium]
MRQVLVRYKVRPEEAAHNEQLARQEFAGLQRTAPAGIHYATFVEVGRCQLRPRRHHRNHRRRAQPLLEVEAFRAFLVGAEQRWEQPPQTTVLREVGAYGLWPEATGT